MKTYKFKARIEGAPGAAGSGGACVYFPHDVEKEFGTRGRVPVKATFDGVPYTGSMIKYGAPQHMLGILKNIREQIGKGPGDMVEVTIEKDEAERTVETHQQTVRDLEFQLMKLRESLAMYELDTEAEREAVQGLVGWVR